MRTTISCRAVERNASLWYLSTLDRHPAALSNRLKTHKFRSDKTLSNFTQSHQPNQHLVPMITRLPPAPLPRTVRRAIGDYLHDSVPGVTQEFTLDPLLSLSLNGVLDPTAYFCNCCGLHWTEASKLKVQNLIKGKMPWDISTSTGIVHRVRKGEILIHKRMAQSSIPLGALRKVQSNFLPFSAALAFLLEAHPEHQSGDEVPFYMDRDWFIPVMTGSRMSFFHVVLMKNGSDAKWMLLPPDRIEFISPGKFLLLRS